MEETIIPIDLFMPDEAKLAAVVKNELTTNYGEVTAEWVNCPDLTQEPFCLAAPGLCGNTALLDYGGLVNVFPRWKGKKIIYFKDILQKLNRDQSDNFIIGGGLSIMNNHLSNFVMNTTFSPNVNGTMVITANESRCIFMTQPRLRKSPDDEFTMEFLSDPNPHCNMYGDFFVSQGLRGQVLKVEAKKRFGCDFIDAMQRAIGRVFPRQLVGLGGTFVVKNAKTIHHIMPNSWTLPLYTKTCIQESLNYWTVKMPVVAVATFVNSNSHTVVRNQRFENIFLTRSQVHGYSNEGGGQYYAAVGLDDNKNKEMIEYLGYFSLATKLYRIDPVPMFKPMFDFSCLELEPAE